MSDKDKRKNLYDYIKKKGNAGDWSYEEYEAKYGGGQQEQAAQAQTGAEAKAQTGAEAKAQTSAEAKTEQARAQQGQAKAEQAQEQAAPQSVSPKDDNDNRGFWDRMLDSFKASPSASASGVPDTAENTGEEQDRERSEKERKSQEEDDATETGVSAESWGLYADTWNDFMEERERKDEETAEARRKNILRADWDELGKDTWASVAGKLNRDDEWKREDELLKQREQYVRQMRKGQRVFKERGGVDNPVEIEKDGRKVWLTSGGFTTDNKEVAQLATTQYNGAVKELESQTASTKKQVGDLLEKADEFEEKIKERSRKISGGKWSNVGGLRGRSMKVMARELSAEELGINSDAVYATQRKLEQVQKFIRIAEKYRDDDIGFLHAFGYGAQDKLADIGTYDFGLSDLSGALAAYGILKKTEKGEKLKPEEEALLDAYALEYAARMEYAQYIGRGYGAGGQAVEFAALAAQLAVNPLRGAGAGAEKAFAGWLEKKGISYAERNLAGYATRLATRTLTNALPAAGLTVLQTPEWLARGVEGGMDFKADGGEALPEQTDTGAGVYYSDEGRRTRIKGGVARNDKPMARSIGESYKSQLIGDWAMMMVPAVGEATGAVGEGIAKGVAKATPKAVADYISKVGTLEAVRGFGGFLKAVDIPKRSFDFYASMQLGNILDAATPGGQEFHNGEGTGVLDLDRQVDEYVNALMFESAMGAARGVSYGWGRYQLGRRFDAQYQDMKSGSWRDRQEQLAELAKIFDSGDEQHAADAMKSLFAGQGLTEAQIRDAVTLGGLGAQRHFCERMFNDTKEDLIARDNAESWRIQQGLDGGFNEGLRIANPSLRIDERGNVAEAAGAGGAPAARDSEAAQEAWGKYNILRQEVLDVCGKDVLAQLDDDPYGTLWTMRRAGVDAVTFQACEEYADAKARVDGIANAFGAEADAAAASARLALNMRAQKDGMLHHATLEDGRKVDVLGETGASVTVIDEDGDTSMVPLSELASLDGKESVDELYKKQEKRILEDAAAAMNELCSPRLRFKPGDVYSIELPDGRRGDVVVLGPVLDPEAGYEVGGKVRVEMPDGTAREMDMGYIQQQWDLARGEDFADEISDNRRRQIERENGGEIPDQWKPADEAPAEGAANEAGGESAEESEQARKRYDIGDKVTFRRVRMGDDGPYVEEIEGEITGFDPESGEYAIMDEDGGTYRVKKSDFVEEAPAGQQAEGGSEGGSEGGGAAAEAGGGTETPEEGPGQPEQAEWKSGDKVTFKDDEGNTVEGTVIRYNARKKCWEARDGEGDIWELDEDEMERVPAREEHATGDTVRMLDDEGNPFEGEIEQETPDGYVVVYKDGAGKTKRSHYTKEELAAAEKAAEEAEQEAGTEQPAETTTEQPATEESLAGGEGEQGEQQQQRQSALSQLPVDEQGNPDIEQARDAGQGVDALVEMAEGSVEDAKQCAQMSLDDAKDALKKAQKAKPKPGANPMERMANIKAQKAAIAEAQRKVDFWQGAADEFKRREEAETRQTVEQLDTEQAALEQQAEAQTPAGEGSAETGTETSPNGGNGGNSLLDAVRTLYEKGKAAASKLYGMRHFEVAKTPDFMKGLGLTGDRFTIRYGVISRHMGKDGAHEIPVEVWEQLPEALQRPFAITEYYESGEDKASGKNKGYRLYTAIKHGDGYIVVGAEVKNVGRDVEVNSISTVFGRDRRGDLEKEIYRSEEITPEQSSLLNEPNSHQYPTEQELSGDKGTENTGNAQGGGEKNAQVKSAEELKERANSKVSGKKLPGERAAKIDLKNFTAAEELRGALTGVYYKDGYIYATDGKRAIKIHADYPEEYEGKILNPRTGKFLEADKYVDLDGAMDSLIKGGVTKVRNEDVEEAIRQVKELRKGKGQRTYPLRNLAVSLAGESPQGGEVSHKRTYVSADFLAQLEKVMKNADGFELYTVAGGGVVYVADGVRGAIMPLRDVTKGENAYTVIQDGKVYASEWTMNDVDRHLAQLRESLEGVADAGKRARIQEEIGRWEDFKRSAGGLAYLSEANKTDETLERERLAGDTRDWAAENRGKTFRDKDGVKLTIKGVSGDDVEYTVASGGRGSTFKGDARKLSAQIMKGDWGDEARRSLEAFRKKADGGEAGAGEKIDDWGEKIEGARKFTLQNLAKTMGNVTEENLVAMPLSKVFPRRDFAKQVEQGKLSGEDALFLEAIQSLAYNTRKPAVGERLSGQIRVGKWAKEVCGILSVIKSYCDAETPEERRRIREAALSNAEIAKEEDAYRERYKERYKDREVKMGDLHTETPVKVAMDILRGLGYPEESAAKVTMPTIKARYDGAYYDIKVGDKRLGYAPTYEEAVAEAVKLAKIMRGDEDITYGGKDFSIVGEGKTEWKGTGRYEAVVTANGGIVNANKGGIYRSKVFDTREEAERYTKDFLEEAKEKGYKSPAVRVKEETKVYFPEYAIKLEDPLHKSEAIKIEGLPKFETREEAQAWMEQNMGELNDRANEAVSKANVGKGGKEKKAPLSMYYEDRSCRTIKVCMKLPNGEYETLKGGFKTIGEARKWMEEARPRIDEAYAKRAPALKELYKEKIFKGAEPRKGADWRKGKDITPEEFGKKFGFRGVQFGNWTDQAERQRAMNEAYDAFMDLAELLGVSPDALSLNGELGIAFGSRGAGWANAHYEPAEVVINLTKTRGAGSLAHEWWHALDNYFSRRGGVSLGMLTTSSGGRLNANVRPEVVEAYKNLVKAIQGSDYDKRSMSRGAYWGKEEEETARLFAEWVDKKLQEVGKKNSFLSSGVDEALLDKYVKLNYGFYKGITGNESMKLDEFRKRPEAYDGWPEPLADEVDKFDSQMKALFDTIQEKKEGGKAVLYSAEDDAIKRANERYNADLEAFRKGDGYSPVRLGKPSAALQASGLNDTEMYIKRPVLKKHLDKHGLTVDDIRDLPKALQNPLMVYEWGDKAKSLIAITEIRHGDDRITVAVKLERGGKGVEVNEIASVHAKEAGRFFEDMAKTSGEEEIRGKLRWVGDKEKALDWLGLTPSSPKEVGARSKEELSVAKVIENFENPKLPREKVSAEREKVERLAAGLEETLTRLNVPRVVCRSAEEMVSAYRELTGREMSLEQARRSNAFVDKVDGEDVVFFNAEKLAGGKTAEAAAARGREITAHEVLGHYGLPVLLGEEGHKRFCGQVYGSMSEASRERFNAYYFDNNLNRGLHGDILKRLGLGADTRWEELTAEQKSRVLGELGDRMTRGAADEYVAHLAERVERGEVLPREEKTLWDSIVDMVRRLLGFDADDGTFGDRDIAKAIMDSKRNLEDRARLEEIETEIEEARERGDRKAERRLAKERDAIERNMEARRASVEREMDHRDKLAQARENHDVFGEARAVAGMEAERRSRRGDVRRSKEETERVLSGVKGQKQAGARYDAGMDGINAGMDEGMDGDLRNSVGRKRKEVMERRLEKSRPDITEDERRALFDYLDTLDDTKMENATFDWFVKGSIRIPEDMGKVEQAVKVANAKRLDIQRITKDYDGPQAFLDANADFKTKGERVNPDDVATLTNKKDYGNGITVYDVADSEESRQNMRKIIDTHFGEDANPWCLLAKDPKTGEFYTKSKMLWYERYNKHPKRVAFKDGKLLAFFANDKEQPLWWDRMDRSHEGLPVERLMDDGSGRTATYTLNEKTGEWGKPTDIHKGDRKNGLYETWHDNGQQAERSHWKNGERDGLYEMWHDNGQLACRLTYKDGKLDGLYESWYGNGQPRVRSHWKDWQLDGLYESWYGNGQLQESSHYKDGKSNGLCEKWYDNGQLGSRLTYEDGMIEGLCEEWHENGQPRVRCTYKDGALDELYEQWYKNGQLKERCTHKDGMRDGLYEEWHDNGRPRERSEYKKGEYDGLCEKWYENGQLRERSEYRDGEKVRDISAEEAERLLAERQAEPRGDDVRFSREDEREFAERGRAIEAIEPTVVERPPKDREEAREIYSGIGKVRNKADGREVEFYKGVLGKLPYERGLFFKAIPGLKESFANSVLAYSERDNRAGEKRPDGTAHKAHPNVEEYHNYVGKVRMEGKDYYVRFTVTEERGRERNGLHSAFVTDVKLYEEGATPTTMTGLQTLQGKHREGVADAKLREFFERARKAGGKVSSEGENSGDTRFSTREAEEAGERARRIVDEAQERIEARRREEQQERADEVARGFGLDGAALPKNAENAEGAAVREAARQGTLRDALGEDWNEFLKKVYQNTDEETLRDINEHARRNGWNFAEATERYLAGLSDNGAFEQAVERGMWDGVKSAFDEMLRSKGVEEGVSDNDARYALWRNERNKTERADGAILARATDVATDRALSGGGDTRFSTDWDEDKNSPDVRYSGGVNEPVEVADMLEKKFKGSLFQMTEAWQDSMQSLYEFMKACMGKEWKGEAEVADWMNPYTRENRLSSKNEEDRNTFTRKYLCPMYDAVKKLAKDKRGRELLNNYIMSKHGLERNEYMAEREAREAFEEQMRKAKNPTKWDDLAQDQKDALVERRRRDYAGLTGLFGLGADEWRQAEDTARSLVDNYEASRDTDALWKTINAATEAILKKQLDTGLISSETYDKVSSMYQHYIPLRGFDDKTADDEYAYLNHQRGQFESPLRRAKGRTSAADDPFGCIVQMAQSAILHGNRNQLVKQAFYNFVGEHPSDYVTESPLWLERQPDGTWQARFCDTLSDGDTPEEVSEKLARFEEDMRRAQEAYPGMYATGEQAYKLPYRMPDKKMISEHQVVVRIGGQDKVLTVNGSPRLAQAINGQTNPDTQTEGWQGALDKTLGNIVRFGSAVHTTWNPDFMVSNYLRDLGYSNVMSWVKEDSPSYQRAFAANCAKVNPVTVLTFLDQRRRGTLDTSGKLGKYFEEYMSNGGETGYARMAGKDEIRKELAKRMGMKTWDKTKDAYDAIGELAGELGRGIEISPRFAAYVTSREAGRDIGRSIYDAKEITVNFNKKGAGSTFLGANGQTWGGNAVAFISGVGRDCFMFWNAGVQGTANISRGSIRNKKSMAKAAAAFGTLALLGYMRGMCAGGDDEKRKEDVAEHGDSYWDLPAYTRHTNFCYRGKGGWTAIPLAIELRLPYGIGEIMASYHNGRETETQALYDVADLAGDIITPINLMEGQEPGNYDLAQPLTPSPLRPIYDVKTNRSWTGRNIYSPDMPWNENEPRYKRAYKNTGKFYIGLSKGLSDLTGGDETEKGAINLAPEQIQYVLQEYLPFYSTVNQVAGLYRDLAGEKDFSWRDVPIANRVKKDSGEALHQQAVSRDYWKGKEEADKIINRFKQYAKDPERYADKIDELANSRELEDAYVFGEYSKAIKEIGQEMRDPRVDGEIKEELSKARVLLMRGALGDIPEEEMEEALDEVREAIDERQRAIEGR